MEERSQIVDLCSESVEKYFDVTLDGGKRVRMTDVDSVLHYGGMKKCSKLTQAKSLGYLSKEEEASQVTEMAASLHSEQPAQLTISNSFVEPTNDTSLSLGPARSTKYSENASHSKTDSEPHKINSTAPILDLNDNPFRPNKKLREARCSDASECGSTTSPLRESEPLRMWKEMKQRGFLSSTHGGIPIVPKQRGRQPKRKKEEDTKKKSDTTRREQPRKYSKNAAPTGLLSGLNPGIIKHVRNSKQVNSIIEAMLQSEKNDSQIACNSDHDDDDSLTLKLSSAISMASENASSTSNDDLSASCDSITSLSLKGASVASQWLDLLQQDIKGRLAALRRSKKRVRNVIQTELPYLLSKEMSSNQENEGCHLTKKAILDMHMAKWKSIFGQMDKSLHEEGKHLESWLKQVQDMQSHCEWGLKFFSANHILLLPEEFSGLKKAEVVERENAVRAAAASIYSTCNFIMTRENVACF